MLSAIFVLSFSLFTTSCKKDDDVLDTETIDLPALDYIGSDKCQACHEDHYSRFIKSGHPYKLNKVNGAQPTIPYSDAVIPTPAGYDWSDVSYLIGGYGWKARFVDQNGYVMTENGDTQYNLEDGSQVAYHGSDPMGTKKYDCGRCHTTGWKHVDDGGSPKDGLEGMAGYFFAGGVHCEECHGMGSVHAVTKSTSDISIDNSSEYCGSCHYRNEDHSIAAKGGFIKHHEQYDEWLTSAHNANNVGCNTCHDPHSSVINDDIAPGNGVRKSCTECHSTYNADAHPANLSCETCHMAKAAKSAIKKSKYKGDINSHLFKINPASDGTLFNAEGTLANPEGKGLSLDYVCYQCHKDDNGDGGSASKKTMVELSTKATGFHSN